MRKHFNLNTNPKKELIYISQNTRKGCTRFLKKLLVCSLICCMLAGCSNKGGNSANGTGASAPMDLKTAEKKAQSEIEQFEEKQKREAEATPTPEPQLIKSKFRMNKEVYDDNLRTVKTIGLKEYKVLKSSDYIKGEKGLLDTPSKGKHYLVLFLEITNNTDSDIYIGPDFLTSKLDGKTISNTFLKNTPEHYKNIFKTVKARDYEQGFLAWEVPEDWKKMSITYDGFQYANGNLLKLSFTKKDLKDPAVPMKTEE